MSQYARSVLENMCPTEAVDQCVKYIVCREGSKIPIKNADIENFLSSVIHVPVDKKLVIESANKVLKNVYGYKLVKLKSKGIQYILVMNDKLPSTNKVFHSTYDEPNNRKILIAALTHIFMSGGTVKDFDMWTFLDKTKLLSETDIQGRKLLTQIFRKNLYLELIKFGPDEQKRFEFSWGQRAEEEISKTFILNKMAQAFDKEPDYWREQFNNAQESDNQ